MTLLLSLLAGALVGLGLALLLVRSLPAQPDALATLERINPEQRNDQLVIASKDADVRDVLGSWALRKTALPGLGPVPTKELALLQIPLYRFFGEKIMYGLIGLILPSILTVVLWIGGLSLPFAIPVLASLVLAAVMFFLPDYNVRDDAAAARKDFSRALASYIDLVALERNSGSGPRQAMEIAASVGDSWVFKRLADELARSRWSGQPPWDALRTLADELSLPELADLSDIMRLSGQEGAQVYATLRARSQSMRTAEMNDQLSEANAIGERMSIPMSMLGLIFMALLITPALLKVMLGG